MTTKRTNTAIWSEKYQRWQINIQKDGVRKSFYSSTPGRTGQREANAKADKWLETNISSTKMRVEEAYAQFKADSENVSSTTVNRHISSIGKTWIVPNIGKKKLTGLCDYDIQQILDKAAAKGRSKKTIQDINGIINKFLKYCRRRKLTSYRPDDVKIPASARLKGKEVLQPKDLTTLMSSDETCIRKKVMKEPLIHAYRFAVLTGLRPGELRGLQHADIDGMRLNIRRSVNEFGEETKGKNENAVRSFIMSERANKELQEHIKTNGITKFVFDLPSAVVYRKHWNLYCEHNGITATTPYELRHTFVSVVKTLPVGEVKAIVGHSQNMDTFGIYGHHLDGEDVRSAKKIDELFGKIIEK